MPQGPSPSHTHRHFAHKLRPLAAGGRHSVIAQLFWRSSGRGTSPRPQGPRGSAGLPLRLSQLARHWLWHVVQEKCIEHLYSLSSMKSSPSRVCCRSWESLSKELGGHLVPQALLLCGRDRPLGSLLHTETQQVNQSEGVSMGLHGPASRKTLTL